MPKLIFILAIEHQLLINRKEHSHFDRSVYENPTANDYLTVRGPALPRRSEGRQELPLSTFSQYAIGVCTHSDEKRVSLNRKGEINSQYS